VGDHRVNPQAIAKAQGGQVMQLHDLGDGVGFAGWEIRPMFKQAPGEAPVCVAALFAVGGHMSPLSLRVELRAVMVGEIGGLPVADLKRILTEDPPAATETPVEAPPPGEDAKPVEAVAL
jgi:hypothetical protein